MRLNEGLKNLHINKKTVGIGSYIVALVLELPIVGAVFSNMFLNVPAPPELGTLGFAFLLALGGGALGLIGLRIMSEPAGK